MRWLVGSLLLIGSGAFAAPVSYSVSFVQNGIETQMTASADIRFLDPAAPSCDVFRFRKLELSKHQSEIDFLIDRVLKRGGRMTKAEWAEMEQMTGRMMNLDRELKSYSVEISASALLPEIDLSWFLNRQFKLSIDSPSLRWNGFDASEPEGFSVRLEDSVVRARHLVYMTEYCDKPQVFRVRLEKL